MTFERSEISLAVEQNVHQHGDLWSPGAYADHLAEAKSSKPHGKGQQAIMSKLRMYKLQGVPTKRHTFTEFTNDPAFRGMHFGGLMKAAEGLAKKGLVKFDGKAIELTEAIAPEPEGENMMAFLSRSSRSHAGRHSELAESEKLGEAGPPAGVAPSASILREDADSPEGATGGFNRHQKLQSPKTRELVLKSRMTEIEAFANDRGYNPQIVFAIAEVSSRMGRVPDLRQYGVYGEEAKAIRHFVAGDILNLAIEDAPVSASILSETETQLSVSILREWTVSDLEAVEKQGKKTKTKKTKKKKKPRKLADLRKKHEDKAAPVSASVLTEERAAVPAVALKYAGGKATWTGPSLTTTVRRDRKTELHTVRVKGTEKPVYATDGMEEANFAAYVIAGLLMQEQVAQFASKARGADWIQATHKLGVTGTRSTIWSSPLYKAFRKTFYKKAHEDVNTARGIPQFTDLLEYRDDRAVPLTEVAPPGFSGTVKAMKDHPEIDNEWALAWHMYGQGAKPRRKPEKGKPRYKSPAKYAADKAKKQEATELQAAQARFYEIMGCRMTQTQEPERPTYFEGDH